MIINKKKKITAADDFDIFDRENDMGGMMDDMPSDDEESEETEEDVDEFEDEDIDDVTEDDVNIVTDNNIEDHYIAECEKCKGIFISAVVQTDQEIDNIEGTCPLCGKKSVQWLRWVIKEIEN